MAKTNPDPMRRLQAISMVKAAELLSVSTRTLQRLIAAGKFPKSIKVGASTRLLLDDVQRYIDAQRNGGR